jgi:hypothetical protein
MRNSDTKTVVAAVSAARVLSCDSALSNKKNKKPDGENISLRQA